MNKYIKNKFVLQKSCKTEVHKLGSECSCILGYVSHCLYSCSFNAGHINKAFSPEKYEIMRLFSVADTLYY